MQYAYRRIMNIESKSPFLVACTMHHQMPYNAPENPSAEVEYAPGRWYEMHKCGL